jgi:hypothetical protein
MLVGVGGSGKQSLAKLASFINGYEVSQISVSSTYGIADFKESLLGLYKKAGKYPKLYQTLNPKPKALPDTKWLPKSRNI